MTPHSDDYFPDTELWDPQHWPPLGGDWEHEPHEKILEWLTLEECESLDTDDWGFVVTARLRDVEYHVGPSTDPDHGEAEIIATLVMGSPMSTELLGQLVEARLPRSLPNNLHIEVDELGENDAHCWLVRRFTAEQLDNDADFAALMEEFVGIAEAFAEGWTGAN